MRVSATAVLVMTLILPACSPSLQREPDASSEVIVPSSAVSPDDAQNSYQSGNQPNNTAFWTFNDNNGATMAIYGYEASDAVFSVSCDDLAEELVFYRAANVPENSTVDMNLLSSKGNTLLQATGDNWELPGYTGRMLNTDPWLAQLMAAETLTVDLQGEDALTVAVSPELKRVVASCK